MDKKIYAKTAGEPIRIKVKSDSSVLYGKTEEIIEEKYCNVTFDFFHGSDSSYPFYKVYISEGKEVRPNFYAYDPSHLLSTLLYKEVPKTLLIKEGIIVSVATGPSDNDSWFNASLSSTDPEIEFGANNFGFKVTKDCVIKFSGYTCLTPDTLITLSDHTQKRIDQLSLSDKVLSYNPKTQKLEEDEITYTDSKEDKEFAEYDIWTFEGGYEVKTVYRHRFYNIERQAMVYMDEWKLGEHAYTLDGKEIALFSHQNIKEKTKHHTLFTKNQNYFANGLLSGNRHTEQLNLGGNE